MPRKPINVAELPEAVRAIPREHDLVEHELSFLEMMYDLMDDYSKRYAPLKRRRGRPAHRDELYEVYFTLGWWWRDVHGPESKWYPKWKGEDDTVKHDNRQARLLVAVVQEIDPAVELKSLQYLRNYAKPFRRRKRMKKGD